ncbi:phosphotransferase [Pseudooceanicola aestuarii]|uniref:phosphotransferase n=1 Tax=Pseudooceanicola aestuarii TaxID=2697319 RepID=UPI0013D1DD7D|nr:phosphotransferase [Pseudooceanicola aestuarii]
MTDRATAGSTTGGGDSPATGAAANQGAGAVRDGFHFDEGRLADWMAQHVDGFRGPLEVTQFRGGQSNPTYRLITPGKSYVLRRKPPGRVAHGAHAVDREARVQQALATVDFPVARIHALCTDDSVIGSWFYVMDMVEGRIFWDATLPEVPQTDRTAYYNEMNSVLSRLHRVDLDAVGLEDYGRRGDFVRRQIARWTKSYHADPDAGRDAGMDALIEWLPGAVPQEDETALIHGDYRCDNLVFHPQEPRVLAVLDWELSTLGHPVADFAYHAMMYRMPPDIVAGLGGSDPRALGLPDEDAYLTAYCRNTGRAAIPDYNFYIAFNLFRLAAIFHGIKGRAMRGNAASAHAQERAKAFPRLVELALDAAKDCR